MLILCKSVWAARLCKRLDNISLQSPEKLFGGSRFQIFHGSCQKFGTPGCFWGVKGVPGTIVVRYLPRIVRLRYIMFVKLVFKWRFEGPNMGFHRTDHPTSKPLPLYPPLVPLPRDCLSSVWVSVVPALYSGTRGTIASSSQDEPEIVLESLVLHLALCCLYIVAVNRWSSNSLSSVSDLIVGAPGGLFSSYLVSQWSNSKVCSSNYSVLLVCYF